MQDDSIQCAIDERRMQTLFAQDPKAFVIHWFAFAALFTICWAETSDTRLFFMWLVCCGVASWAQITIWLWHERRPNALSPRHWINLHTMCRALLFGAQGLSIWVVEESRYAGSPLLNVGLALMLAVGICLSIKFDRVNLFMSMPLLLPGLVLYLRPGTFDRNGVALVCAFVFVTIHVYGMNYRKLFRRIALAQVDQRELAESLDSQKEVAEDAALATTRFLEAARRDLRQPLHSIGILAGSLNDTTVPAAQRVQVAGRIREKVDALNGFLNQLLDYARIESGVTPVTRMHFRLSDVFDRIGERYRPLAAEKGLALRIAPTTEVVFEDPVLLEHVVGNLVSNAVRFTDSGAIWMGFRRAGLRSGGYIEVRDSGTGIAPSEQQRIGEAAWKTANDRHGEDGERGLGFATVRRLAGLLGGELKMRSAPGRGSTFRFRVHAGDATQVRARVHEDIIFGSSPDRRQILCIGDEAVFLEKLAPRLGWVVHRVRDEVNARLLIERGLSPDAVLCDCQPANLHTSAEALVAIRDALVRHGESRSFMLLMTGDIAAPELDALARKGISVLQKTASPARLLRMLAVSWQRCDRASNAAEAKCNV